MHSLVLGAGINPRVSKVGPKVRLGAGKYRLVVENIKDTMIFLYNKDGMINGESLFDTKGELFWYQIEKVGTEEYLNIFAELISGSNTSESSR